MYLKRGKVVPSEGVEMPDGERIKEIEKNGSRYFRIQQNQGELSERISEENKINHEK